MSDYEQGVFISYAWNGESEEMVDQIEQSLRERGIRIIRDKRDLDYKGSIGEFMERIGRGSCVIVIISDKYLRSPNCMFELVNIADGKDFHDRIFQNQGSLSAATYKQIAADLNLDASAFGQCLDSGKHRESIQADVKEGESMGVTGTPAFFINGRFLSGAQPFEAFKAIIDDELSN